MGNMENDTVRPAATAVLAWPWILSCGDPIQESRGARFGSCSQNGLPNINRLKLTKTEAKELCADYDSLICRKSVCCVVGAHTHRTLDSFLK